MGERGRGETHISTNVILVGDSLVMYVCKMGGGLVGQDGRQGRRGRWEGRKGVGGREKGGGGRREKGGGREKEERGREGGVYLDECYPAVREVFLHCLFIHLFPHWSITLHHLYSV